VHFLHQEGKTAVSAYLLGSQTVGVVTQGFLHMLHTVKVEIIQLDTNNVAY
jgi:hypothetical protein